MNDEEMATAKAERAQEQEAEDLGEALVAARQEAEEYRDKYLRALAEMENYKKRLERAYDDRVLMEKERLLQPLLEVVDNLERAIEHGQEGKSEEGLLAGVEMVGQQLLRVLEAEGVEIVESLGQPFDPRYHEAVEMVPGDGEQEMVAAEIQKGYLHHGRLLRPARVRVAVPAREQGG